MSYVEIEPARAKAKDPEKIWGDPEWIAEEKLDGWRFLMHFGERLSRVFMTGRRVSSETGFLSEKGLCARTLWPHAPLGEYTVLDGEVMPPRGRHFRDLAGIMNVDPEDAAARIVEIGSPIYRVFDILFHEGRDLRELCLTERRKILKEVFPRIGNENIKIVPSFECDRALYDEIVLDGGEGVILKELASTYGESGSWIKVKKFSTLDVVITGFTDAKFGRTGKYSGQIGAAVVSVYSAGVPIEVGQVSGMDDATRLDMSRNKEAWIGSVVEIAAQEFAKERLRHPRFLRRREESNAKEATWEKMMADLGTPTNEDPKQGRLF